MQRRQINATLKRDPDAWEEIEKEGTARSIESPLDPSTDDEYFHVETREELLEVLNGKGSYEAPATTTQLNEAIKTTFRPPTPYPRQEDEDECGWTELGRQQFDEMIAGLDRMGRIPGAWDMTNQPEKTSEERMFERDSQLGEIVEGVLGSTASQTSNIPTLRREDATLRESNHACLSWTACYEDDCQIHISEKEGSGWYPKRPRKPKRQQQPTQEEPGKDIIFW